jgi:hypothetical protein
MYMHGTCYSTWHTCFGTWLMYMWYGTGFYTWLIHGMVQVQVHGSCTWYGDGFGIHVSGSSYSWLMMIYR